MFVEFQQEKNQRNYCYMRKKLYLCKVNCVIIYIFNEIKE